ncbi:MAG: aspartyl protease family protein [Blastocatellia bacterium]|nr:aspartyl protease family protein [Blastocatellia bacterium]
MDQALARRKKLSVHQVRTYEADALVDTGAVAMVIPPHVQQKLGLLTTGHRMAEYADGRKEVVDVTEPFSIRISDRETIEEALVLGAEVLVGQTVLAKTDLLVDCANQRLVPNPAHPDQPVTKIK